MTLCTLKKPQQKAHECSIVTKRMILVYFEDMISTNLSDFDMILGIALFSEKVFRYDISIILLKLYHNMATTFLSI